MRRRDRTLVLLLCGAALATGCEGDAESGDGGADVAAQQSDGPGDARAREVGAADAGAGDGAVLEVAGAVDGSVLEVAPTSDAAGPAADTGAVDQAPAPPDAAVDVAGDSPTVQQWFAFAPSNIAIEQLRLGNVSELGAAVLDSTRCEIDVQGEVGAIRCLIDPNTIGTVAGHKYLKVRVVDGPLLDVFVARSWTITARTTLPARGLVALVALEDIVIEGAVDLTGRASGTELGVGPMGDFRVGAGGGGFCGHGGAGAYSSLGRSMVYGTADLIPPRVGSSGGPGALQSGAGGGFLHLLAGRSVRVAAGGKVGSGGTKGYRGGGGGSGGAILIEAPQVTIAGAVAANGEAAAATARARTPPPVPFPPPAARDRWARWSGAEGRRPAASTARTPRPCR